MSHEKHFQRIDAEAARRLLARGKVLVLDSRDQVRFDLAHIPTARHLTSGNLDAFVLATPKATPVLIYCYHGNASQTHAQTFADFGFGEVYSLDGGFAAWQRAQAKSSPPALTLRLAQWLREQGYPADDLDAVAEHGMTPLMRAAKLGDTAIMFELIQSGAALDATNVDGNTALWLACVGESLEAIDLLIRAGTNPDHQNDNGATCLMYAASTGKHRVVEQLLASGADPGLKSLDDFTALDMAATIECLRTLRKATKDPAPMAG